MNRNHFFFPYAGIKRNEVNNIFEKLKPLDEITTVVEPFCGSSAFSVFLSQKYPKRFKYVLNDKNENLLELYRIVKNGGLDKFTSEINELVQEITDKENYDRIKKYGFKGWFISNIVYNIRSGLYKTGYIPKEYDFSNKGIVKFLHEEDVEIRNEDGEEIVKEFQNDEKCLIFLDPPYLQSCNDFYSSAKTNVYEYLYHNKITDMKSYIILCLEDIWIIRLLFPDNIIDTYDKKYESTHRKTKHILITNK